MTESPALADDAPSIAARIEGAFEWVWHQRMAGLPFVNENLRVELVGLRRWRGLWLGALVTPWFMNLMLLPGNGEPDADGAPAVRWPRLIADETAPFVFPAGPLQFCAGREGDAGPFLACSLFSPMFEFADHEVARQTAEACLAALFDAAPPVGQPSASPTDTMDKRDFLRGRWQASTTINPAQRP